METHGGTRELLYFKAEPDVLRRRLAARNLRADANALSISDDMLADFIARFEGPTGEDETVLAQTA